MWVLSEEPCPNVWLLRRYFPLQDSDNRVTTLEARGQSATRVAGLLVPGQRITSAIRSQRLFCPLLRGIRTCVFPIHGRRNTKLIFIWCPLLDHPSQSQIGKELVRRHHPANIDWLVRAERNGQLVFADGRGELPDVSGVDTSVKAARQDLFIDLFPGSSDLARRFQRKLFT
jgi:hypothetical protein